LGEEKTARNWFVRHVQTIAKNDAMTFSERIGNLVGIAAIVVAILFFVAHQTGSTGFFTSKFGIAEIFLFYATLLYGLVENIARFFIRSKNTGRLFDVFGSVVITIALAWFFVVFPFNFAYVADVLPDFLRFLLQWISNDVARALMILGLIVAPVSAVYQALLYLFVRRELSQPTSGTAEKLRVS
jgi:hypothetical protein